MTRNRVYAVGATVDAVATDALTARGLEVARAESAASFLPTDPSAVDPELHTVLLSAGTSTVARESLTQWLRQCKAHLDLGFAIVIPCFDTSSLEIAGRTLENQGFSDKDPRVRTFDLRDTDRLRYFAETVATHAPGPPLGNVQFEGDDPGSARLLLSRAFGDFERARLRRLYGGSAAVFLVQIRAPDRNYEPFIAKVDDRNKVLREIANYRENVELHVAFPHRPPILYDRCVDGSTKGVLVSWFASQAESLDRRLDGAFHHSFIDNLFKSALCTWRSIRRDEPNGQIAEVYQVGGRLFDPNNYRLRQVYAQVAALHENVRPPDVVHRELLAMPRGPLQMCWSHGDLHTRNIFVRAAGNDTILLDFYATKGESHSARDPATLEVSIAFPDRPTDAPQATVVPEASLRALYRQGALNAPVDRDGNARVESILSIRELMRAANADPRQYDISLGIMLLSAASRGGSTLAYSLGESLLRAPA